ncbi:MAG: protein phosphatase 2C domain-containing protein [Geminocystis sp.]|nr:protein phosphatase 2C domain-containing protein [Geminocystis sp.]HIK38060.1 protein phosphatase 2C domain-containing protein [Geminocystis sp. M7585_C2015_104]MCS7147823.1 protein phosphatase 2C domain-containing protein [Geminocystis sp.]MCX8079526.1 protein phosphatase 2C domain-containing protein [Geminocystis sp.]MDW8116810.1 protein phosphatase 2C domain-containing protein [Geminocystis sp.]
MTDSFPQIRCIVKKCKAFNPLTEKFCRRCHTPVVKRYLRVGGRLSHNYSVGDLLANRFFLLENNIVLDTRPDLLPTAADEISPIMVSYLRLFSHRLHLPQIYGCIEGEKEAFLLEYDGIPLDDEGKPMHPNLFPLLQDELEKASPLRQVNWLWQMLHLVRPLFKQKVLSSLLAPDNLGTCGSILKIIELRFDGDSPPTIRDFGKLWATFLDKFHPSIRDIIGKIVACIEQSLITDYDQVLEVLDQVAFILGNNYYNRSFKIITATDAGKKRKHNEDSCYPPTNELKNTKSGIDTLVIVCDGLGGQKSGEIASNMAIKIVQEQLKKSYEKTLKETLNSKGWLPLIDAAKIHKAITIANDQITALNDQQKRKERERMGTTIVMAMACAHEIHLASVGDSRVYWITKDACHQLTVDDDLATKEVRMGCGFYRPIAANPRTGALLQALGMDSSRKLTIHIRRFICDEESVFLLCSDGLSDYERVEQYWHSHILPIITEGADLKTTANKLIEIGLGKNGHDNITVALLHAKLEEKTPEAPEAQLSWQHLTEIIPSLASPQPSNTGKPQNLLSLGKREMTMVIAVAAVLLATFLWWHQKSNNNKSSLWHYKSPVTITAPEGVGM